MILSTGLQVSGLGHSHQNILDECLSQLTRKAQRNRLRRRYYDSKMTMRNLGISIPSSMTEIETVLGWPAKGVDALSRRLVLEGFTFSNSTAADTGLSQILEENRFDVEAPQAHTSALISSVAWLAVTAGDVASGEPEVILSATDAEHATGIWDSRRRMLRAALTVLSVDDSGLPDHMVLYVPGSAIIMRRTGSGWDLREARHSLGVPVEPLVYNPSLDRPFGRSRITRPVMRLTDGAIRTLGRGEVGAEFFASPQRYALGADEDAFVGQDGEQVPGWVSLIGRMLAIGRDEDGEIPTVGQFPQHSMEPHLKQLDQFATQFGVEVNLPPEDLGVIHSNPSSEGAIMRAKEGLVLDAKFTQRSFSPAWERQCRRALMMLDGSPAAQAEYATLRSQWANPATPSLVSASDAMLKQVQAVPGMAEWGTEVVLAGLGHDQVTIDRLMAAKRRQGGAAALTSILERAAAGNGDTDPAP